MNYIEIVNARLMVMAFAILSLAAIGWAFVMHLILGSSSTGLTVSYTLICIFASSFVCSFSSGVLGASTIGRERAHLELVWSKPAPRWRFLLAIVLTDYVCIAIMFVMGVITAGIISVIFHADLTLAPRDLPLAALALLFPLCAYSLAQALVTSWRNALDGFGGIFVIVMFILELTVAIPAPAPLHAFFHIVNFINPVSYFGFHVDLSAAARAGTRGPLWTVGSVGSGEAAIDAAVLLILTAAGLYLTLLQWRKLEIA